MNISFNNSFDFEKFELLLPIDIQNYVYSKIIYTQPCDLLEDIRGYNKKIRVFSFARLCKTINNDVRFMQTTSIQTLIPIRPHTTRQQIRRRALLQ